MTLHLGRCMTNTGELFSGLTRYILPVGKNLVIDIKLFCEQ